MGGRGGTSPTGLGPWCPQGGSFAPRSMVPDHLNRALRQTIGLLRRPGTGILLATTSTLVLVLSLVGFTAEKSGDQLARKPSLLDLLDEVARDAEQKDVLPGLPPKAPKAASWSSP